MYRESLDETIDRVARTWTEGRPDPVLSKTVRARVEQPSGWTTSHQAMAAALIVVALISAAIWQSSPPAIPQSREGATLASKPLVVLGPYAVAVRRANGAMKPALSRHSRQAAPVMGAPLDVQPLSLGTIEIDSLTVLEPLRVDSIQISDISGGQCEEFK